MTAPTGPQPADDGLVRPISFEARHGDGHDRTLVLGGGGIFFIAWQIAYLNGLAERGVDLKKAEIIVGTSAGSVVASLVAGLRLHRAEDELELFARFPALVGRMAPADDLAPSQQRALLLFAAAVDAEPATLQHIGHAALAADAAPATKIRRSIGAVLGMRRWPSPALHTTAVDTFTGERLVVTADAGIPVAAAAAASSSVPGLFSPQPLHDRRAMDGGVSGSGIHTDLVAGASRALVLSVSAQTGMPEARMTMQPDSQERELAALAASGTEAQVRGPADVDPDRLMDPSSVPDAMRLGEAQAEADGAELAAFWADRS
jgi:NTE family protein